MSNYNVGDKFEIEIDRDFVDKNGYVLYLIKGFNSLVFDENGLDKLKKVEEPPKPETVKASELPIDTVVLCGRQHLKRHFATLWKGTMYAFNDGLTSKDIASIFPWQIMTLEDGTVVLPE